MIHDSLKMFARKSISRKACSDPFRKRLTSFSVGLPWTVCSFVYDFIALEIMESVLTFLDDNLCKFHALYACTGGACALETRRRFVTERGKKESRKLNPGLTAWVTIRNVILATKERFLSNTIYYQTKLSLLLLNFSHHWHEPTKNLDVSKEISLRST